MKKTIFLLVALALSFTAQAAVITISPATPDALRHALNDAADGDVIEMAEGTYVESNSNYIAFDGKSVTVKAAEGANVVLQPQVPITISNGAKATLQGIKIDASHLQDVKTDYEHVIYATDNTDGKELVLDGCEVYGYSLNSSVIYASETNTLALCKITNCYFHDIMKSCLFFDGNSLTKLFVSKSTFANIATTTGSYWASVIDVRNMDAKITVDHCTFYDCQAMNTDHAAVKVATAAVISNSVFVAPASQSSYRAVHATDGSGAEAINCLTYNYGASKNGIRSACSQTNCIAADPLFVKAANGNFAFQTGSPALGVGTHETNLGDPRWNPSANDDKIEGDNTDDNTGDDNTGDDNTGDDNTGDDENEEEDTTIDFESRGKVYVSPTGSGSQDGGSPENAKSSFASAYNAVLPGQAIVMADGIYEEAYVITMDKEDVIIKAAEGAKPILKLTGEWTSLHLTATVQFDGIAFDGNGVCYYPISSMGTNAGKFTFLNCDFTGWVYWGISHQYEANTHVDKVIIDKCTFHDAAGGAVRFNENAPSGKHSCGYFKMTNSTLYNLVEDQYSGIIHVSSRGEATGDQNEVIIDHITMYNNSSKDLGCIAIRKSSNLKISNSIVVFPTDLGQPAFYIYGGTVTNTLYLNGTAKSGPTYTGCITEDPMFVFPEGGNFNLRPGSPALNAGTDGKHLGDTRWGEAELVAVSGIALDPAELNIETTDTVKIQAVFYPVEATNRNVTWSVADPTIISLKNGKVIGLKAGETTITVTTEDGGFTATANVVVKQKIFHPLVLKADTAYQAVDYTVPSYVQFLIAKEAARRDSSAVNVAALQAKIDALQPYQSPYDLVVNINGDPKTRMAFAWFTNDRMTEGKVQLVAKANATEADFADAITLEATQETTESLPYIVDDSGIYWKARMSKDQTHTYTSHKAVASDLTPNTTYTYRVGTEGYWSELGTFITAPEQTNEFSFIYMSDAHIMTQAYIDDANSAARAALNTAPEAKFCAFPGDFVDNYCNSEWEWERLFEEALRPMAYQMPIVPTDGNHDVHYNPNYSYHFNTDNSFKTHASVKPYADGTTYSFMYGDVLFLVFSMQDYWRGSYSHNTLTSVYLQTDVANWFKEQVAAHPEAKLRVAMCHYNIFSGSSHQDDEMGALLRATMLPVMKECEIDFVIQGHDHCYEVMGPVDPDTRKPIMEAIEDREAVSTSVSMSGYKGGTYTVNDGSMYFIGSTCGHKRYWPNSEEEMNEIYDLTKVDNYFSLFTGMFAQPDKPSFSVFTVNDRTITVDSYLATPDGSSSKFNTFVVKRTVAHTGETDAPTNLEQLQDAANNVVTKVLYKGQILLVKDGVVFNVLGQQVK